MTEKEIQTIISQVQKGETELFGQIFELFADKVFCHATFRVKDREIAKDITSEVFLGAWQSLSKYRPQANAKFSTWLFSIARRIIADHYRKGRRSGGGAVSLDAMADILPDEQASPEEITERRLASNQVLAAVQLLPPDMAEAVTLRYVDEMEYEEMAVITGKRPGHLRVLVHRGLQRIRKSLKNE